MNINIFDTYYVWAACDLPWRHFISQEKLKTMLMQNFGLTNKEHYGMLWYFLEWSIHLAPVVQRVDSAVNLLNNWRLDVKSCSHKNYIFISYYIPKVFGYFFFLNDMSHDVFYTSWQPTCVFNTIYCRFLN